MNNQEIKATYSSVTHFEEDEALPPGCKTNEIKNACYIKQVDGKHLLFMPDGTQVPRVVLTRVKDQAGYIPECIVKLFVNLK